MPFNDFIIESVLDYWGPKAPGSCYYALLGSPFPYKSYVRMRSSMKAEPISDHNSDISGDMNFGPVGILVKCQTST